MSSFEKYTPAQGQAEITCGEMQRLEQAAFASGRVSSWAAMETAGSAVSAGILAWPLRARAEGRAPHGVILAGPGNNGGDAYVVARRLHEAGWQVSVYGLGEGSSADSQRARAGWAALGPIEDLRDAAPPEQFDVLVDGLFGIGLTRGIEGALAARLEDFGAAARTSGAPVFAIDLPSGLEGDTGQALGAVLPAHHSVTFHRPKPAHRLRPDLCGTVTVAEIGL